MQPRGDPDSPDGALARERQTSGRHSGPQGRGGRDPNRRDGSLLGACPSRTGWRATAERRSLRPASRGSAKPAPMTLRHANGSAAPSVRARRAHPGTHAPPPIRPKPLQIPSIHPSADTKSPRKSGTFSKPIDTALVERSRDEALFAGAGGGSHGIFSCHCVSRYATTDAITPAMTPIPKLPASSSRRCDFLTRPAHTTSPGS